MSDIDIDVIKKFCDENPFHQSPRDELEAIFEYVEDVWRLVEATHLLDSWDRNNTPDFFFMKWGFTDADGQPWRPAGTSRR
jgi:hypothetical protein